MFRRVAGFLCSFHLSCYLSCAYISNLMIQRKSNALSSSFPDIIPQEAQNIVDQDAIKILSNIKKVELIVKNDFFGVSSINSTYYSVDGSVKSRVTDPVLLLHGFDSSCLEFRRLLPLLEEESIETYAVDILGWGFSQYQKVKNFGPEEKRCHLYFFWKQVLNERPMILCGASLGAATAIDFYLSYPEAVTKLILIDGQVLIDGSGPGKDLPMPLARIGINVLQSAPLRSLANKVAFFNKKWATDDAMKIGRLHTFKEGWKDASLSYMKSGGYVLSHRLGEIQIPTLVLWGRQDEILDPLKYAEKFAALIKDCRLVWIEDCGHTPHLEQASKTVKEIVEFIEAASASADGY